MRHTFIIMLTGLMALWSSPAPAAILGNAIDDIQVEARTLTRYTPESADDNGQAELSVVENNTDLNFTINPEADVTFELDFIFKNIFLSDNGAQLDLPSLLVGRSMRVGVAAPVPFMADPDWRFGVAVLPTYYTDSWEDSFNDFETGAFRWLSEYFLEYRGSERFYLKAGITYRPEYDYNLLPIIEAYYQISDDWLVRVTSDDFNVVYTVNDRWKLFTEHRYVNDEFEISIGSLEGRPLIQQQNNTGLGVQYNFSDTSYVKVSAGAVYNRKFKTLNPIDARVDLEDDFYSTVEFVASF